MDGPLRCLLARRWAEIGAALVAVLLYLPTLGYGLVFDDLALLDGEGMPVPLGGLLLYRPLRFASHLVDGLLGGSAVVAHAHNVLLHGVVAALVVALARRLGAAGIAAFAGGVLVACHPLAVEAAAYVSGRRDLLCVALGLGALLAQTGGRPRAALLLVLLSAAAKESGLVFFVPLAAANLLGLTGDGPGHRFPRDTDAAAATGNGDGRGGVRASSFAARRLEARPFLWAVLAGLVMVMAYGAIGPFAPSFDLAGLSSPGRVAAHYAASLAWPMSLAPEYPALLDHVDRVRAGDARAIAGGLAGGVLLVVANVVALAFALRLRGVEVSRSPDVDAWRSGEGDASRSWKVDSSRSDEVDASRSREVDAPQLPRAYASPSRRSAAFAGLWSISVLDALAVWGGLHEPGVDRHAYLLLPALGVALAVAWTMASPGEPRFIAVPAVFSRSPDDRSPSSGRTRRLAAFFCASALALLALTTRGQMESWRSERTLWTRAVAMAPGSARAHANLAAVLAAEGSLGRATHHLNRALAIDADVPHTWLGRAAVRCAQRRPVAARLDLVRALERGAPMPDVAELGRECPLPEFQAEEFPL